LKTLIALIVLALCGSPCYAERHLVIPTEDVVAVFGHIGEGTANKFKTELAAKRSVRNLWILLQGNGGYVGEGQLMITAMAQARARGVKIHCLVVDFARSMHTFLWDNCDSRYLQPMTRVLWHKMLWLPQAPMPLSMAQLQAVIQGLENDNAALYTPMQTRTGLSSGDFDKLADTDVTGLLLDKLAPDYFELIDSFELKGKR
jgi:ATP-dependent protease ClpP protease subunit